MGLKMKYELRCLIRFLFSWLFASVVMTSLTAWAAPNDDIVEERRSLDETAFAEERLAGRHGEVITALWDRLREDPVSFAKVAADFLPSGLTIPAALDFTDVWESAFGTIGHYPATNAKTKTLESDALKEFLPALVDAGWRLDESEFHHLVFESGSVGGSPPKSTVNITLHVSKGDERVILRGKVHVTWKTAALAPGDSPTMEAIDASGLQAWTRSGELPFKVALDLKSEDFGTKKKGRLSPVLVHDFDGDGLVEIALGGANVLLRNGGDLKFKPGDLLSFESDMSSGAAVADFDGDGRADLLASAYGGKTLRFHPGRPKAEFEAGGPAFGMGTRCLRKDMREIQCITVADVDSDGDMDAFLGQYRGPYKGGNMPQPFYDANDGHPSYLLFNSGKGSFRDVTSAAGLGDKRNRRVYGASFADMNGDGNLDLAVTSDFAGVDVFAGDGKGQFVDKTKDWIAQPRLFGMTHVISDLDRDGEVDLFAVGMASTTARRLERMGLGLESEKDITANRESMGHGNRLYLSSQNDAGFALSEPKFAHDVCESGWSWGASDPDLDNNGHRDLYIANGHISGKSACDYCSTFWRHDIYTNVRRKEGQKWDGFFSGQLSDLANLETSWNGYEHNVAFMQRSNGEFTNLSYLLGISNEEDSRVVVAADLDRDGDLDLVTTVMEKTKDTRHRLVVFENGLATSSKTNWIGIDLGGVNAERSPWNAVVSLARSDGSVESRQITTGGAFASQPPTSCHFGLGEDDSVQKLTVSWADGHQVVLDKPAANVWHTP